MYDCLFTLYVGTYVRTFVPTYIYTFLIDLNDCCQMNWLSDECLFMYYDRYKEKEALQKKLSKAAEGSTSSGVGSRRLQSDSQGKCL